MSVIKMVEKRVSNQLNELDSSFASKPSTLREGIAFMQYALNQMFKGFTPEEIELGIVDSGYRNESYDYGIDAIYLTANGGLINSPDELYNYNDDTEFIFNFLQFKKGTSIDIGSFIKFKDGIRNTFINQNCDSTKNEYMSNYLENLFEIRDELYENFPADNIKVKLYFCFGGLKNSVESNSLFTDEMSDTIKILHDNAYFNVTYEIFDSQEFITLERKKENVTDILKYEKAFKYITAADGQDKLNGYLCIVNAYEIGKLVSKWKSAIFEANIRDYLPRNITNLKILETCTSDLEAKYFWSFNNGLTITCQGVEELPNDKYKLKGLQVVNGCQTSSTLSKAYENNIRYEELIKCSSLTPEQETELAEIANLKLNQATTVLVKLIETNNPDLIYRITETTNSQTPVKVFSLKANEDIHKNIEQYLLDHKLYYERRVNYYKNKGLRPIITIQSLAQLYLSMILFKPSQARSNPKNMFIANYNTIFPSPDVKSVNYLLYFIPIEVDLRVQKHIKQIRRLKNEKDEYSLALLGNGRFHLDCYVLKSILGSKYSEKGIIENASLIFQILKDDQKFTDHFQNALYDLTKVVQNYAGQKKEAVSPALRKAELDKRIVRDLNRKK